MLRVLSECSASVRKPLQGLDNYAAEGARAFDDLAGIVENISTNVELDAKKAEVLDVLKAGKLYLKGEYKVGGYMNLWQICNMVTWLFLVIQVHTSSSSEVADHCSVHALIDPSDKDLCQECDHQHDERCSQCDALDNVLVHTENLVHSAEFHNKEDKDEAFYLCRTSVNYSPAIQIVSTGLVREAGYVLAYCCCFPPDRGNTSVAVLCSSDAVLLTVFHIWQHILKQSRTKTPASHRYTCAKTTLGVTTRIPPSCLAANIIEKSTGVHIEQIDFSDPQGGKGAADRLAARCKSHIRVYIRDHTQQDG